MTLQAPTPECDAPVGRATVVVALSVLTVVGAVLRLRGLGALELIVDEGIQALAVRGILEHGVPRLDSGLIYDRALPFLYAQAAIADALGVTPFALRLPSALLGALVVWPGYLLGKTLFDRRVGLLAATVLAFSCWEIELSRYARSYPLFQALYVFAMVAFYRGFLLGDARARLAFVAVGAATLASHALGLLMATWFVLPLAVDSVARRVKLLLVPFGAALGVAFVAYRRLTGAVRAAGEPFVPGWQVAGETAGSGAGPADAPSIAERLLAALRLPGAELPDLTLARTTLEAHAWMPFAVGAIGLGAAAWVAVAAWRDIGAGGNERERSVAGRAARAALGIVAVGAAACAQVGLTALALGAHVVGFGRRWRDLRDPTLLASAVGCVALAALWAPFAIAAGGGPKAAVLDLFGYPNVLQYLLYFAVSGWPAMAVVVAAACVALLGRHRADRTDPAPWFSIGSIAVPAIAASVFATYLESRYAFHLYPMVVVVFAWAVVRAGERIVPAWMGPRGTPHGVRHKAAWAVLVLVAVVVGQDANPVSAWRIGDRTYASARDPMRAVLSWRPYASFHQDHASPARYVREHRAPGDVVVAFGPVYAVALYHWYADGVDRVLNPSSDPLGYTMARDGEPVHYVLGVPVLASTEALDALIEAAPEAVWLIGDRPLLAADNAYYDAAMRSKLRDLCETPDAVGRDGETIAVRVARER